MKLARLMMMVIPKGIKERSDEIEKMYMDSKKKRGEPEGDASEGSAELELRDLGEVRLRSGRCEGVLKESEKSEKKCTELENQKEKEKENEENQNWDFNVETGERPCLAFDPLLRNQNQLLSTDQKYGIPRECCKYRELLKYILRELRTLTGNIHASDESGSYKDEWVFSSFVYDRLCFYVLLVLYIGVVALIMLSPPNHWDSLFLDGLKKTP